MLRKIGLAAAWAACILGACTTGESGTAEEGEYVIIGRNAGEGDSLYFNAIQIHTRQMTPVTSILETSGRLYSAPMNRYPECQHKVVQGRISPERVFLTSKVLRDTTVPTVGQ